ncbi:MAG: serine--tRNA ligase, partial [Bartonella sp.]|nr:serine--tRNA ligase [Bartonella sp.]
MLDIKWIRDHPEELDRALAKRGLEPQAENLQEFDRERRLHVSKVQQAQELRNLAS